MDADVAKVRFGGFAWKVKDSNNRRVGPGNNLFSAGHVVVDSLGRLRLDIARTSLGWTCAEVIGQGAFGHGTYRWSLASGVTGFEAPVVLGLFTWSDQGGHANRELDIEFSRWGRASESVRGGFTLQRESRSGGPIGVSFPPIQGASQHELDWLPGRLRFRSTFGESSCEWSYGGAGVPPSGGNVAPRMNLWLYQGSEPAAPHSVLLDGFSYTAR